MTSTTKGVLVVIGVATLIGLIAYFSYLAEKKRVAQLTAWARRRGWSYSPDRRKRMPWPFELFDQGHSRYTSHHVRGELQGAIPGLPDPAVEVFHYHYATESGSGKDRRTQHHHYRCVVVDTGIALGEVTVRTENFFDKFAAMVGFDDIDFEDPEFSKRFHVSARDRRSAYALLEHELTDFLTTARTGFMTHGPLLMVHEGGYADADHYERLANFTAEVLVRLPRLLVNTEREYRGLSPLLDAGAARRTTPGERGAALPE